MQYAKYAMGFLVKDYVGSSRLSTMLVLYDAVMHSCIAVVIVDTNTNKHKGLCAVMKQLICRLLATGHPFAVQDVENVNPGPWCTRTTTFIRSNTVLAVIQ